MRYKPYLLLLFCFFAFAGSAQSSVYVKRIKLHQHQLNHEFANPEESPLTEEGLEAFDSLAFFPIDSNYCVLAYVEYTPDSLPFEMRTTTARLAMYRQYAWLHFSLGDSSISIPIYENLRLKKISAYKDYLFLPFTDLSNGAESYGGGRFLDARIPEGDSLQIDFNKAYNPYCAYNSKYSCPIPPKANHINFYILAGVKAYEGPH